MILFLNKKDLFQEKIERVDLKIAFDDYYGGKNYTKATEFIQVRNYLNTRTDIFSGKILISK
jgi:hypothetical protein